MRAFKMISKQMLSLLMGFALLGSFAFAQDESPQPENEIQPPPTPLKVAIAVQDSSGLHWDAEYLRTDKSPSGEPLNFIAGDSTGCTELDCYRSAAEDAGADYLLLLNVPDKLVTLYDPASDEKLAESSLDNPFTAFEKYFDTIVGVTDTTAVANTSLTLATPDSSTIDSVSAAMDSLAAEALTAAQAAARESQYQKQDSRVSSPGGFTAFDKVLYRHLRTFSAFVENPSYLAMDHETKTAWSAILPLPFFPMQVRLNNSAFTPGWVKDWFHGQYLTEADKREMTGILRGKTLDFHTQVDFPTLLGVRVGPVGFNAGAHVAVNGVLPGDLLMLPWSNFTSDNPLTNLDLNFETLNYLQTNIGYGQVVPTPLGDIRAGAGVGLYVGYGFAKFQSDQFTMTTGQDSIVVDFSGTGFFTDPSIGLITDPNTGNMDMGNFPSSLGFGVNLGAGMDLYDLTGQRVDVQVSLSNIGATLNWSNVTEKRFSAHAVVYDVKEVMDNSSDSTYIDSLLNPTETVLNVGSYSVSIPVQFAVQAQYQPIRQILVQASYRQSFSNGVAWTTNPRFGLYVGYFPIPAFEIRGALNSFMGQVTWSSGWGVHLTNYELGLDITSINGIGGNASGLGVRMTQSFYF